mmetsp:Transcript_15167/g.40691  ORF Transcript_15167/g.40691 Transcript_15167/m.40691 type:complete len:341 (-) Transcript_15167:285-1307(-)
MANRTDPLAQTVHGTNPQYLVEKIVRTKIYNHGFWKEHCFGLTAETLIDRAVKLEYVGGTYGGARVPTEFLMLTLKMLQIQPEREIILELIVQEDHKYVRALGAFYLRLTGSGPDIYNFLEPLYNDYRKLRTREASGSFKIVHMDEFVETLLDEKDSYACDIALPALPKRTNLVASGGLEGPRVSALEEELEEELAAEEEAHLELMRLEESDRAPDLQPPDAVAHSRPPPPPPPRRAGPPESGTRERGPMNDHRRSPSSSHSRSPPPRPPPRRSPRSPSLSPETRGWRSRSPSPRYRDRGEGGRGRGPRGGGGRDHQRDSEWRPRSPSPTRPGYRGRHRI